MGGRIKAVISVHVFFIRKNKILLLKRKNTGFGDKMYSVPAGHLEKEETVIDAAIRETEEETTALINRRDLFFIQVMHRLEKGEQRIDFFFQAKKWQGKIKINEPNKCSRLKWVEIFSLPNNTVPYIRDAVKNYLKKKKLTVFKI